MGGRGTSQWFAAQSQSFFSEKIVIDWKVTVENNVIVIQMPAPIDDDDDDGGDDWC